jgi:hypothetical protein
MSSFEILAIIVFLNVAATITLWRTAARRPEKLKKKFLDRLWHSKPITPKHQPPPPLEEVLFVRKEAWLQFVSDFEDFANVVNWHLVGWAPWRLQELPTFELSKLADTSPAHGRRYAVFHNQARLGGIEVEPDSRYSTETPGVTIHIELNCVHLLPFETIRSFLTYIAGQTFGGTPEYFQTNEKIDLAMMGVLWKTQEISQFGTEDDPGYGKIEVESKGLASSYLKGRQAFRNQAAKAKQQS